MAEDRLAGGGRTHAVVTNEIALMLQCPPHPNHLPPWGEGVKEEVVGAGLGSCRVVGLLGHDRIDHGAKQELAVLVAQHGFGAAFRMRHETQHVACRIANPGNIIEGAVGIGLFRHGPVCLTISEHDLGIGLESGQGDRIGMVIALGVGNGKAHHVPGLIVPGKVDADPSYSVKRSECEPIRTRCNSFPSTRYIRSQSGSMCVSRYPFQIPRNG